MNNYQQLQKNLHELKLTQISLQIDDYINKINEHKLSIVDALCELTSKEVEVKNFNATNAMVKVAGFPHLKEIKDFDFDFQPSVNKAQILEFESLGFIDKKENIVFLGPSGVGKTHLATAIGIASAKKRNTTYFIKCHDLIMQLKKAKLENRLEDRLKHFNKYKLLIIDELGYLPIDKEDSKLFFQLIDRRYENKSTIITTNINFGEWDDIFGDPVIANAIVDRILHHAKVVTINGKSYRLKDHLIKKENND